MKELTPVRLAVALGLGLALGSTAAALEPSAPLPSPFASETAAANQKVAEIIAGRLQQSGRLRHYAIDVVFRGGAAELSGVVADAAQHDEAVRIAHNVPGVSTVIDRVSLANSIRQVRTTETPANGNGKDPTDRPKNGNGNGNGPMVEPQAEFSAPPPQMSSLNPPKMPPYAWPTYAPYNNYSRVAYPEAYPYNAWPFIGPVYPFPKVPLGWRAVKLEYDDGHWWFSKVATKHDWWRLRYW